MPAAKLKLYVDQGSTFRKTITWKVGVNPAPVDLTGCRARMQVRASLASKKVLVDLNTENGGLTLGGTAGTIEIFIDEDVTAKLPATAMPCVYDLELILSNGDVKRLCGGNMVVSPEVTR